MSIKITNDERLIIENLISTYSELYDELDELEKKIDEASRQQNLLKIEYDNVNAKLLSSRNEEYLFFQKMKKKYPEITNLKELIE
jgi:hypothetical protein